MNLFNKPFVIFGLVLIVLATHGWAKLSMQEKMKSLRTEMQSSGCDAYIVVSEDEHQSEYVSNYDKRRAWITDFSGSAGVAVVTAKEAGLWTDSRYYIEAEKILDKNFWTLMKASEASTVKIEDWLNSKGVKVVHQNAKFTSISSWNSRKNALGNYNITFESPKVELIDKIWPADERPSKPNTEIVIHELKYTGRDWAQKVAMVQDKMSDNKVDLFIVTALDEVAWLFNLRASDIPYNPMFFAYAIINNKDNISSFYVDETRPNFTNIKTYLKDLQIKKYDQVFTDIQDFSNKGYKIWMSPYSSYAIYNSVQNMDNLISNRASPIRSLKAKKSDVELQNMRKCHIRDSAARIKHWHWIQTEMDKGSVITEITSADKLEAIQKTDSLSRGPSFSAISAVGANAAIVHYTTSEGDNSTLTKNKVYLLDAGGQYEDCTTDITRTHHFGKPSDEEKTAYTKVLQGSIGLSNIVFPTGVYGRTLDLEARAPLWKDGMDYGHGTGHGIGYYLSVHESPPNIAYSSNSVYDETLAIGMISSNEPGYYEQDKFGIRLETDIEVVKADTKHNFGQKTFLKFDSLTFVPFDVNLINTCQLTDAQVDWLNSYNNQIKTKVLDLLQSKEQKDFLLSKTEPFKYHYRNPECSTYNSANIRSASLYYCALTAILLFYRF